MPGKPAPATPQQVAARLRRIVHGSPVKHYGDGRRTTWTLTRAQERELLRLAEALEYPIPEEAA